MAAARNANFELLRVIAMFMVVYHHFGRQTQWGAAIGDTSKNYPDGKPRPDNDRYFTTFTHMMVLYLRSLGKVGVHLFVMISGYFLNTRSASLGSFIRVWFRTCSWTWFFLFCFSFVRTFDHDEIRRQLLPVLHGHYWYVTAFLTLMALSPMLGSTVEKLSQRQLFGLICFLVFVMNLSPFSKYTERVHNYTFSLTTNMISVYFMGAFFRKFPKCLEALPHWFWLMVLVFVNAVNILTLWFFENYDSEIRHKMFNDTFILMTKEWSILSICMALPWFLWARKITLNEPLSKIFNLVGGLTFGIYVCHENNLLRGYIWTKWLRAEQFYSKWYAWVVILGYPVIVFFSCAAAEYIRQKLLAKVEEFIVKYLGIAIRRTGKFICDCLGLENADNQEYQLVTQMVELDRPQAPLSPQEDIEMATEMAAAMEHGEVQAPLEPTIEFIAPPEQVAEPPSYASTTMEFTDVTSSLLRNHG